MNELEKFIDLLDGQVRRGIYVWGGDGEIIDNMQDPVAWIRTHETSAENAARAIKLFTARKKAGVKEIRAFDCSGLVYWALKTLGLQKTDVSSRGLYALCKPIKETELRPGDLVFHHDGTKIVHVGVCVGSEQIECRGRDVGVVKNKRRASYWNRFGRLPALQNDQGNEVVKILGGSVRVREGGSTKTRCIGIVHRGETYPLIGRAESGWYQIEYRGTKGYVTNNARYTEVQNG